MVMTAPGVPVEVCETLQRLHSQQPSSKRVFDGNEFIYTAQDLIAAIFPNVKGGWVGGVRESGLKRKKDFDKWNRKRKKEEDKVKRREVKKEEDPGKKRKAN